MYASLCRSLTDTTDIKRAGMRTKLAWGTDRETYSEVGLGSIIWGLSLPSFAGFNTSILELDSGNKFLNVLLVTLGVDIYAF